MDLIPKYEIGQVPAATLCLHSSLGTPRGGNRRAQGCREGEPARPGSARKPVSSRAARERAGAAQDSLAPVPRSCPAPSPPAPRPHCAAGTPPEPGARASSSPGARAERAAAGSRGLAAPALPRGRGAGMGSPALLTQEQPEAAPREAAQARGHGARCRE